MYTIQHFDLSLSTWCDVPNNHDSIRRADKRIKQLVAESKATKNPTPIAHYRIIPTDLEVKLIPPAADHHYTPPTEQERISDQAVLDKLKADAALTKELLNTPTEPTLPESIEPEYIPVEHAFNKTLNKTLETKRRRERYGENFVISKKDKEPTKRLIKKVKEPTKKESK